MARKKTCGCAAKARLEATAGLLSSMGIHDANAYSHDQVDESILEYAAEHGEWRKSPTKDGGAGWWKLIIKDVEFTFFRDSAPVEKEEA